MDGLLNPQNCSVERIIQLESQNQKLTEDIRNLKLKHEQEVDDLRRENQILKAELNKVAKRKKEKFQIIGVQTGPRVFERAWLAEHDGRQRSTEAVVERPENRPGSSKAVQGTAESKPRSSIAVQRPKESGPGSSGVVQGTSGNRPERSGAVKGSAGNRPLASREVQDSAGNESRGQQRAAINPTLGYSGGVATNEIYANSVPSTKKDEIFPDVILKPELRKGLNEYDCTDLFKYQETHPLLAALLMGEDCMVESKNQLSGNARIAVYSCFLLQKVDPTIPQCQALIVVPYRDMAEKIEGELRALGKFTAVRTHLSIGGTNVRQEMLEISNGVHIIVATPGRVHDVMTRKAFKPESIKYFLLEKAENFVDARFKAIITKVINALPKTKQTVFFTSIQTKEVKAFGDEVMKNDSMSVELIDKTFDWSVFQHFYYIVDKKSEKKIEALYKLRRRLHSSRMVIFCGGEKIIESVLRFFQSRNEPVVALQAKMRGEKRKEILDDFDNGSVHTLITNEIPSRGCSDEEILSDVQCLINYQLPVSPQNYMARIQHCGTKFCTKHGIVVSFLNEGNTDQLEMLNQIELALNIKIQEN